MVTSFHHHHLPLLLLQGLPCYMWAPAINESLHHLPKRNWIISKDIVSICDKTFWTLHDKPDEVRWGGCRTPANERRSDSPNKNTHLSARLVGLKVCRPWEVVALTVQAHSLSRSNQVYNNSHVAPTLLHLLKCKVERSLERVRLERRWENGMSGKE